jgi:hypothetical protein
LKEKDIDLVFTCIPYWDKEIYSLDHTTKYQKLYENWKDTFIVPLKNYLNRYKSAVIVDHFNYEKSFQEYVVEDVYSSKSPLNKSKGQSEKLVLFNI